MEEPRPGQKPEQEQRPPAHGVHEAAAPSSSHEQTPKERAQIDAAQEKAERDQAALRRSGHGDHQGEEGFLG